MKLHVVRCQDNDLYGFYERTDVKRCSECRNLLDKWNPANLRVELPKSMVKDISVTYDGLLLVSQKFVRMYQTNDLKGLSFVPVAEGFYVVLAARRVRFDSDSRGTRFESECSKCGQYEAVAGATPAFLNAPIDILNDEFVWTDIEFGSGDEKHPLLICGEAAGRALRNAKLKGLDVFAKVH